MLTEERNNDFFETEQNVPQERDDKPRRNYFFKNLFLRLGAGILDFLIFLGGIYLIDFVAALFLRTIKIGDEFFQSESERIFLIKQGAILLWFFIAIVIRDLWDHNRSVGKRFCNLKVFSLNVKKVRFYHVLLRNLPVFLFACGIIIAFALPFPKNVSHIIAGSCFGLLLLEALLSLLGLRRLGDLLAGTKIIFYRDALPKPQFHPAKPYNGASSSRPPYRRFPRSFTNRNENNF